ncbi:proline-rich membrane anchor 1 isoform X2 [Denticeps clupeoides]|uniref:proline-rich membrane anchor 1 isoform X2 n=1 Tax=Denticeps clupeoides TaxID=299321 RepID=UPI0010A2B331|nr:proline-rich membrane anchor 1-like isoform X2 [Denticeps clupeoides]
MSVRNVLALTCGFLRLLLHQHLLVSPPVLGEPQKSCSWDLAETAGGNCQLACRCRPYPPLPPPPPPPLPPRVMSSVPAPVEPARKPHWNEMVVLVTVSCASVIFLLLAAIICYKAIKRKPLRKEENGTSRGEYSMSTRTKATTVDTNSTNTGT